ncbi:hypothetical protein [Andreprevotia chitinilytica]|uniref:hypothetical protein n=1 Tax=Andreprevotia chitinilytica TaxID=396808 RepID=UPI0012EC7CDA|nr:hypothetical protein [Andreprevotia chitinilytica]
MPKRNADPASMVYHASFKAFSQDYHQLSLDAKAEYRAAIRTVFGPFFLESWLCWDRQQRMNPHA